MSYKSADTEGADYGYTNNKSSATGKYYFLWNEHGDNIKKITGVKSKEEFVNSPEIQEQYFKWYRDNGKLKDSIARVKKISKDAVDDEELAKIIHFKGETGAKRYLEKEKLIQKETTPTKISPKKEEEIIEQILTRQPVTTADRELWEKMQSAMYQRGIYEDELDKPKGVAIMKEFGIDPARLPDYEADILTKEQEQKVPGTMQRVTTGFSSRYQYGEKTPRQRYIHYASQRGDKPVVNYGTDIDAFLQNQERERTAVESGWAGFGDPTADINYRAPGTPSGWGGSPGLSSGTPPVVSDPRFPTRDELTGKVTPAQTVAVN